MRRTEGDGTAAVAVRLLDGATLIATVRLYVTADRQVSVLLENEPGVDPLGIDSAWSKEG